VRTEEIGRGRADAGRREGTAWPQPTRQGGSLEEHAFEFAVTHIGSLSHIHAHSHSHPHTERVCRLWCRCSRWFRCRPLPTAWSTTRRSTVRNPPRNPGPPPRNPEPQPGSGTRRTALAEFFRASARKRESYERRAKVRWSAEESMGRITRAPAPLRTHLTISVLDHPPPASSTLPDTPHHSFAETHLVARSPAGAASPWLPRLAVLPVRPPRLLQRAWRRGAHRHLWSSPSSVSV